MSNKEIQYISIIKMDKNIKLDYQIFTNNKLLPKEQLVFSLNDGNISAETLLKIQLLETESKHTIISAICEDSNQMIVNKKSGKSKDDYSIAFDDYHNIVLPKEALKQSKDFYNNGNIDYLISPFTILRQELATNSTPNSLNIFILNNTMYSIFLDQDKKFLHSSINFLTPYCDIKKSNFYTDEVVEQILYDEIYILELGTNISSLLNQHYSLNITENQCEQINIFYAIKYLEPKQIEILKENVLVEINYNPLNLEETLDSIVKSENIKKYSFTSKRPNKAIFKIITRVILAIITILGAIYLGYSIQSSNTIAEYAKTVKKEIAKIEYANLPNHILVNQNMIALIKTLFESIDDNSLLKEMQVSQNESTIVYNFKDTNPYEKTLKPKLLETYEMSENILTSENKGIYTSVISNTHMINENQIHYKKYIPSQNTKFLSSAEAKKGIEQLFNETSVVKLLSETKDKYTQYKYSIYTIIKSPNEFFEVIALLEKQEYSIMLDYPIGFAKTSKGLELNFRLTINQNNK